MQQVDDPPSLPVGTEVSAKYKGAFCEAKVRKVVRNIKVKVAYKQGLGSGIVPDDAIKSGVLRVGAVVEVKHPDRRENVEATITKIQDGSQYTVVFDDGDITTLRRSALCLKSGRHFNESETLDQLPLTHPEHFGNPVIGGRRGGRRSRHLHDESSDEEDEPIRKGKLPPNEKEEHIGKVVCVEANETKKKDKEKWFPGLVVAPTAQVTVKIRVKDEYLVRSFKDGRYYTVPKKEAMEFTKEMASKQDGPAVQAALEYLNNENNLPPHWDRDLLFGLSNNSSDYEGELDSDSSDDEPREEKDHFVAQLYKHMDDRGTPLNKVPSIQNRDVDFYRLFRAVQKLGGYNRVTSQNQWKAITIRLGYMPITVSVTNLVKQAYKKFLQPYEEFHRKLGCSMLMTPRNGSRSKGRSLVRANSVASPKPEVKEASHTIAPTKITILANEESENTSESSIEMKAKRKTSTGSNNKVKNLIEKTEDKSRNDINAVQLQEPSTSKTSVTKEKTTKECEQIEVQPDENGPSTAQRMTVTTSQVSPPISPNVIQQPQQGVKKEKLTKAGRPEEKRGRKKKEVVEPSIVVERPAEKVGDSPSVIRIDFPVEVGDKLKVYYHEKTVTYEAKVIEISVQKGKSSYLVHYTGWNNRYDEWVPKERIAENLTNNKTKKSKVSQGTHPKPVEAILKSGLPSVAPPTVIKSMTVSKRGRGRSDSQPPRSTTPSSVASNSSRTKSPATPAAHRRITRTQPNLSRRTSNNISDISMQTDSDSDSDAPVLRKPTRASNAAAHATAKLPAIAKISSNISPNSETEEDDNAKGRDYDLNQIRNELKGFKELKSPIPEPEEIDSAKKSEKLFEYGVKQEPKTETKKSNEKPATGTNDSKSSSEISSDTDSFGDDDSQSSDKTTRLENMTEKIQQKIKAEKDKLVSANSFGNTGPKNTPTNEIISPLAGVEKIIKDSLAEKRQETMKATKPFSTEKIVPKQTSSTSQSNVETDDKSSVIKIESAPRTQSTRQNSIDANIKKPVQTSIIEAKIQIPNRMDKKFLQPTTVITSPASQFNDAKPAGFLKKELDVKPTNSLQIKTETSNLSGLQQQPKQLSPANNNNPLFTEKTQLHGFIKNCGGKDTILKTSGSKSQLVTTTTTTASSNIKNDIYEFKEPEPFEFEARKTIINASSSNLVQTEVEKKKKILQKSPFDQSLHEFKPSISSPITSIASPSMQPILPPSITSKKKKSPVKDHDKSQANVTVLSKQMKLIDDKSDVAITTTSVLLSPPTRVASKTVETTFDVLRKSPSFNLNINALNEELATTVQETTKALTDVNIPTIPLSLATAAGTSQKMTYATPFGETIGDISNVFEMKQDIEKSSSDDDEQKIKKRKNRTHCLEAVKKILLSADASGFDLDSPKIEKPSIADKVLKALNQKKEEEAEKVKENDIPKNGSVNVIKLTVDSPLNVSNSIINKVNTTVNLGATPSGSSSNILLDSVKKEMPILIKKDFDNSVNKPILNSPEHKLDILESIAPKNNDLTETIQKLESAILMKTANVDHFDEDSSDSTDSERRLVIQDDESSEENILNDNLSAPEYSPLKKNEVNIMEIGTSTSAATVAAANTIASLSTLTHLNKVQVKIEEKMPPVQFLAKQEICKTEDSILTLAVAAAAKDNAIILPSKPSFGLQPTIYNQSLLTDSGVKPIVELSQCFKSGEIKKPTEFAELLISVKKEEPSSTISNETTHNLHNDSINSLLCEETIPGSPQPATAKDIMENALSKINLHPTESNIKQVPMDIECASTISTTNNSGTSGVTVKLKPEQQTPSSSPHDSQSQDDSSEDLKKQIDQDNENGEVSPKKRRRTRKQSEAECHMKRRRGNRGAEIAIKKNGSDSDENSDANISQRSANSRPMRPCQYNFLVQLDAALNPNQRISILRKKITELRKTYNMIKAELASIDRRRKKLRRREREKKQQQKQLSS